MKNMVEESANHKAARGLAKIIAVAIVLIVAAFGDVMYIQAMQNHFPSGGPLLIMCYIGAFTSFLAVIYLLMGKSLAFRPGAQMIGAWAVFVAELAIIALNILLVFSPHTDGLMGAWAYVSPATPVMHMLGVALLYFLDPDLKTKHEAMEMQEKIDRSNREVELMTHQARVDLRRKQIFHVTKSLDEAVNSAESLRDIQQFGYSLNRQLLAELTGMSPASLPPARSMPGLPAPAAELLNNDAWLARVNSQIEQERARRLAEDAADDPVTDDTMSFSLLDGLPGPYGGDDLKKK